MLGTLYALAAILFGVGMVDRAVLVAGTLVPAALALPFLEPCARPLELGVAAGTATLLALAVAEGGARSMGRLEREQQKTRELAASRAAYRDLAESARDLIWAADRAGKWTYVNDAVARFVGMPASMMIGRSAMEFLTDHPGNPQVEPFMARVATGEPLPPRIVQCATARGPRWIEALGSGIFAPDGTLLGVRGISRDITERVVAEQKLRESEEKFRTLAETMGTAVFIMQGTRLRYVNAAAAGMTGHSREEQLAMHFWEVLHPDEREIMRDAAMARERGEQVPTAFESRLLTKAGEERWVDCTVVAIEFEGAPALLGTALDVTGRKRAEAALRASLEELERHEGQLRLLARRQALIREDERKRLGLDLHDGVCQELIGVGILLESLRRRLDGVQVEASAELGRVVAYVNEVVEHLRLLARDLRPILLHDLGLEGSLRSLAAGMSSPGRPVVSLFPTPIPAWRKRPRWPSTASRRRLWQMRRGTPGHTRSR